ncbi:hypothetical protein BGZ60DRAFT_405718 [Tricladium varicosporioides]|nr:hypothetical protein BGZ60DRAFT_405718 [Hymenoscyphus varicosporioides]
MTNRLIQGGFGNPGNFELALLDCSKPQKLVHFWRDDAGKTLEWHPGDITRIIPPTFEVISTAATSAPALIQSGFNRYGVYPGNFELLVLEGSNLVHYYHDNTKPTEGWHKGGIVSTKATAGASFIQGKLYTPGVGWSASGSGPQSNFEAVVLEGSNLVHYWRDNAHEPYTWYEGGVITTHATGPGCIIQSTYGKPGVGNFEVLVPEGNSLNHYWRDNSQQPYTRTWNFGGIVTTSSSPASFIQSDYHQETGAPGNFEAVVYEQGQLVHYWRNNGKDGGQNWIRTENITSDLGSLSPPATIIQSTYGRTSTGGHGNFEVVYYGTGPKGGSSMVLRYRDNTNGGWHWGGGITDFELSGGGIH